MATLFKPVVESNWDELVRLVISSEGPQPPMSIIWKIADCKKVQKPLFIHGYLDMVEDASQVLASVAGLGLESMCGHSARVLTSGSLIYN